MDRRRQSILKQDGRILLQETLIPDFPEEDTATVTVTKSRRVSFGTNFVKEFIVGSAVSTQCFSEYEQVVSSSDSSNPNSSRSGILDQSSFHCEQDALNLCVKAANQDEFEPLKKKYCFEKSNGYGEISDKNNENIWDFNVNNGPNIFSEKNLNYSNKSDLSRNNIRCNKNMNSLNDSLMTDKQFQNKRNESELNGSKLNETLEKKSKVGKFSSTIFFSADSPTADVEFTEGCISLAKSIFDKKKKDMTVYIKGTTKENPKDEDTDGSKTISFESEDSDVGMKLTKCMDESESENYLSTGTFSNYFPVHKRSDPDEEFDEFDDDSENVPLHMYSMNMLIGRGENSQSDAELEKSLFYPERSLTEMLQSDPLKATTTDFSSMDKDNTEECDMEISNSDMLRTSIVEEDEVKSENPNLIVDTLTTFSQSPAIKEDEDCISPVFSRVMIGGDLSLMSEESELSTPDPLKTSVCNDLSLAGIEESNMEIYNSSPRKNADNVSISVVEKSVMEHEQIPPSAKDSFHIDSDEEHLRNEKSDLELSNSNALKQAESISGCETEEEAIMGDQMGAPTPKGYCLERSDEKNPENETTRVESPDSNSLKLAGTVTEETVLAERMKAPSLNDDHLEASVEKYLRNEESKVELPDSSTLKQTDSVSGSSMEEPVTEDGMEVPSPNVEACEDSDKHSFTEDNHKSTSMLETRISDNSPPVQEHKEITNIFTVTETNEKDTEETLVSSSMQTITLEEASPDEDQLDWSITGDFVPETLKTSQEHDVEDGDTPPVLIERDREMDVSVSLKKEDSMECTSMPEKSEMESTTLQETRFCESLFVSDSSCGENYGTSLGDKKILGLLTEQSEESNCCWTIDSINSDENFWIFSFPILKSSVVMKFRLMPPKDKSILSFSIVLDSSIELRESNSYQLEKDRIGIEFVFGKLKNNFHRESRELENVHKMPLFLDKMNLIMTKMNGILNQVIRILKEYPGSKLKKSVLSFRLYSFPLLFSCLVSIDMTDPFQLSENSISVKKHFGNFKISLIKSVFSDCLRNEKFLIQFIRILTNSVVGMERGIGLVTKRSHIRLLR